MSDGTDWHAWHDGYEDASSDLSHRLEVVRTAVRDWADVRPWGRSRVISICAGQGHDLVGALTDHPRRAEVTGLLVDLDPANVRAAQGSLDSAGLTGVRAVVGDAGRAEVYRSAVPADLVLVCGVFGNVPDDDVARTVRALPQLCADGATVVWTRHRRPPDLTPALREWFARAGFAERSFTSPGAGRLAVGVHVLTGPTAPFDPHQELFAFVG